MNSFFGFDNKLFSITNKIVDTFFASILWLLFSLPIITFGTSVTAFYYTVHKCIRRSRGYVWQSFWNSFRSNFRQTTKIWMILLGILVFLIVDCRIIFIQQNRWPALRMIFCLVFALIIFLVIWSVYIFAYSARFENGMKDTMKNAMVIALLNLPWSLLLLLLLLVGVLAVSLIPVLITIIPTIVLCICDLFLERVFRKYMSEEDLRKEEGNDKL